MILAFICQKLSMPSYFYFFIIKLKNSIFSFFKKTRFAIFYFQTFLCFYARSCKKLEPNKFFCVTFIENKQTYTNRQTDKLDIHSNVIYIVKVKIYFAKEQNRMDMCVIFCKLWKTKVLRDQITNIFFHNVLSFTPNRVIHGVQHGNYVTTSISSLFHAGLFFKQYFLVLGFPIFGRRLFHFYN